MVTKSLTPYPKFVLSFMDDPNLICFISIFRIQSELIFFLGNNLITVVDYKKTKFHFTRIFVFFSLNTYLQNNSFMSLNYDQTFYKNTRRVFGVVVY